MEKEKGQGKELKLSPLNNLLICRQYLSAEAKQLCVLALLIKADHCQVCLHLLELFRQTGPKPEIIKWDKWPWSVKGICKPMVPAFLTIWESPDETEPEIPKAAGAYRCVGWGQCSKRYGVALDGIVTQSTYCYEVDSVSAAKGKLKQRVELE